MPAATPKRQRRCQRVPDDHRQQIVCLYLAGWTAKEAGEALGYGETTVVSVLKSENVPRRLRGWKKRERRYSLDESFFEQPLTRDDQAYLLGFIAADGCVSPDKGRLAINLARSDEGHLLKIAKALSFDGPIRHDDDRISGLSVYSAKMLHDLGSLGITPRKSLTVRAWDGPDELMPAYWRGVIDGDGCWCVNAQGIWSLGLAGSRFMTSAFAAYVNTHFAATVEPRPLSSIWSVEVCDAKRLQRIAAVLYSGATIWLDRKRELVNHLLSWEPKHRNWRDTLSADELRMLRVQLGTWRAVADHLGTCESQVRRLAKDRNIPRVNRDWSHLTADSLAVLHTEHGSWGKVAAALDMHKSNLQVIRRRLAAQT